MENLVGKKFNRWTVISFSHKKERNRYYWNCLCECGNTAKVSFSNLKYGLSKSCGCLRRETSATINCSHHLSSAPIYIVWQNMLSRCNKPNNKSYKRYGGRGIKVCERWYKFENFLEDMPGWTEGLTLDRINVNGNYEPENCRWATLEEQGNNKRNNRVITIDGVSKTLAQWSKSSGLPVTTIFNRLQRGVPAKEATTAPQNYSGRKGLGASHA